MRITDRQKQQIVEVIQSFDADASIYLFGSRAHDHLKGGDIDLLVLSQRINLRHKIDILVKLKRALGDQKIDLKIFSPEDAKADAFCQSVLADAIVLQL